MAEYIKLVITRKFKEREAVSVVSKFELGTITIGRASDNDVSARLSIISRKHGTITYENKTLSYEDHSRNGTVVNGKMKHKEKVKISQGSTLLVDYKGEQLKIDVLKVKTGWFG
ncbi:hypothetical protein CMO92_03910 [Candidatus Woesearchaeota archaeon]|nr:hypothetical protein [Candidatus Woesearchaeota archaeon]